MRTKPFAAAACAVAVAGAGAGAALAGEVTGPPGSPGNPGTPLDTSTSNANSICVFSGLNDFVNGPTDFIVQSFGQDVRLGHPSPIGGITDPTVANPGDFCGGFSNPDNPRTPPH
jgi:hypothetical protein